MFAKGVKVLLNMRRRTELVSEEATDVALTPSWDTIASGAGEPSSTDDIRCSRGWGASFGTISEGLGAFRELLTGPALGREDVACCG